MLDLEMSLFVEINSTRLADSIVRSMDRAELTDFILSIDEAVGDTLFTENLVNKLKSALNEEKVILQDVSNAKKVELDNGDVLFIVPSKDVNW